MDSASTVLMVLVDIFITSNLLLYGISHDESVLMTRNDSGFPSIPLRLVFYLK
jgi:hypothetical protein